ncbi:MAG: MBL fold metallo-hydrolase, partial [Gammaproteobacteria bacterium]|nr:MBL fold metallo-hydrolase [Gammaproteobacteria bacterium]
MILIGLLLACTPQNGPTSKVSNATFASPSGDKEVPVAHVAESNLPVATSTYLGNEAVMFEYAGQKVLFDPFFHNGFGQYQLVPETIREALFEAKPPYDNINLVFISHAHADHFNDKDMLKFLKANPGARLIAPQQALDQLVALESFDDIASRVTAIKLAYKDTPVKHEIAGIEFDVVRIPHAGWPQRANVANLVFRVTLGKRATVVHMGDADPDDQHFRDLMAHWNSQKTDTAFPPYWFLLGEQGRKILQQPIQASENISVH